jgi:hypothetical protein
MQTITRETLIERLTELQPRELVEASVDRALLALGWQGRPEFNGLEVITIGTKMAENAHEQLADSADAADREAAEDLAPLVGAMRDDLLPMLSSEAEAP